MTYRSLKTFINNNKQTNNDKIFDLIPTNIKSKIIFVIGDGASNTAAYLSSIMSTFEIGHFHFTNDNVDIYKKFLINNVSSPIDLLCENAEKILKLSKRMLSNDDLLFCIALSFCDYEYAIIEISEEYYSRVKDIISPFALVFAFADDEKSNNLIKNAPQSTKEIISLSKKENYDYISNNYNQNGARITLASPNKITVSNANLLGISFYHYDYLYHVSALDINNVALAHLAIESARVIFSAPRPYIYKGLDMARPPRDLLLYAISPTILLREGNNDFKLHHRLRFKTVTEDDKFEAPTENTIFCGSKEYIEKIKDKLKKR